MNKFENVDVLASLQQIMQQNTAAFQSDFDIDKKILTRAAKSKNAEDNLTIWETGDCSAWRLQSFFAPKIKGTRNKYRLSVGVWSR